MKWLILRGLVREQRHWGKFPKTFEQELRVLDPAAKVYSIDYPGFGTEASRPSPQSIPEIVEDIRKRWLKLKEDPNEPWCFLAMSLGGMNALHWCSTYPNDFQKLILVNSSVSDFSPLHKRMKPKNYLSVFSLLMQPKLFSRERKILSMTTNLRGEALESRAQENAGFALPVRRKDAISQIMAAIRFRAPKDLTLPILVLVSRGDQLVDPSCSYEVARHYHAELREHGSANHDLPEDDGVWIATQVNAWLKEKNQ